MTTMLLFFALGYEIKTLPGPEFGFVFTLLYLAICWFAYIWPRADHFVLHERGIRIRSGFKRLQCPFVAIQGIFVGRAPSTIEEGLSKVLGLLKPGQAAWLNQLNGTAITVVLCDGTAHVFKALLTRFEPADLEKLFQVLVNCNPRFGAAQAGSVATEPKQKTATPASGQKGSFKVFGLVLAVIGLVLALTWYLAETGAGPRPLEERFDVTADQGKTVPVKIRKGEFLGLSVSVTSGSPVDVRVGKEVTLDENKNILIKDSEMFKADQVRDFHQKERWPHPTPAVIIITTPARSEGLLKIEVSPAP
jgi:hypothetical protein